MLAKGKNGPPPHPRMAPTFSIKRVGELTLPERQSWVQLRSSNPALYSPYFDIVYTDHVAALRRDTYVVMARRGEDISAFLPYQSAGKFAAPIGAPMTDYHGVIKAPDEPLDAATMLQAAGLGAFNFNALIDTPLADAPAELTIRSQHEAAVMDISKGAEAWRAERDGSYRRSLKSLRRRIRNAESEIGPRRFVFRSHDQEIFDTLMTWKRKQFNATGKYDVLSADWTHGLLERLWKAPNTALRCELHALYFGDVLAAIDFGLTDNLTYHSWIVAYENDVATYSPGIQLLEGLIDEGEALGYKRIDLGAGTDGYKKNYATDPLAVKEGFIAMQGAAGKMLSLYGKAEILGEEKMSDLPGKMRRRYTQIANCDPSFTGRSKAMLEAVLASRK